jgi:hypothetical protein
LDALTNHDTLLKRVPLLLNAVYQKPTDISQNIFFLVLKSDRYISTSRLELNTFLFAQFHPCHFKHEAKHVFYVVSFVVEELLETSP